MKKPLVAALLVALVACTREDARAAKGAAATPPAAAPATPKAPEALAQERADLQAKVPGFPLDQVPPYVREDLVAAAQDEFVYDGSPSTLAGCLKDSLACKDHAIRGLTIIASALAGGATKAEALAEYNRYYGSFAKEKRTALDVSGAPCMGAPEAKITLVEFADFECGHCKAARPVLAEFVQKHPDVRLCFKNYPLPGHTHAMAAAEAAMFAHAHGKFWPVEEALFEKQDELSNDTIKKVIAQAGLDPAELVKQVDNDHLAQVVGKDRSEGEKLGIEGTPTIFVNGRMLGVGITPELLLFTVQDELDWMRNGGKWSAG